MAAEPSRQLLSLRLGVETDIQYLAYGEALSINGVRLSFHPAGHMLGSAQVRLEYKGQVVVVTGDYKLGEDVTCEAWEPVRCNLLVTESTFGLPIYRWPPTVDIANDINAWWRQNRDADKCSVLYGYAVGKSQSLLAAVDPDIGPIYTHGAVEKGTAAYRDSGSRVAANDLRWFHSGQTRLAGWFSCSGAQRARHKVVTQVRQHQHGASQWLDGGSWCKTPSGIGPWVCDE